MKWQFLLSLLCPILIGCFLFWFSSKVFDSNVNELNKVIKDEHIVIHLPKAYLFVGVACAVVFASFFIIATITKNDTFKPWIAVEFAVFILLGLYIIWGVCIWRIDLYRSMDYFVFRSSFLICHKVYFSDCEFYFDGNNILKLKTNNRTFRFDRQAANIEMLIYQLNIHKVRKKTD